jgi:peptide-methionine (R)-S-oxide reductase
MKEKTATDARRKLTKEQHDVLINKATERPFTGKLLDNKEKGKYLCANCGAELFDSNSKFDSGTGWPSFYDAKKGAVKFVKDGSFLMKRTEVLCSGCGGHLGHIFDDAPKTPTGKRYCINSCAMEFKKEKGAAKP